MKRTKGNQYIFSLLLLIILGYTFIAVQSSLANGNQSPDLLYTTGAWLDKLQLAPKEYTLPEYHDIFKMTSLRVYGDTVLSDVSASQDAEFRGLDASGADAGLATLNIGYPTKTSVPNLARLQVNGNITVSDLSAPGDKNVYCLCAGQYGELRKCGVFDPDNGQLCQASSTPATYSWVTTDWGSCTGTAAASCSGSYDVTTPSSCSGSFGYNDDPDNSCSGQCGQCSLESCNDLVATSETECLNYSNTYNNCSPYNTCVWTPGSTTSTSCAGPSNAVACTTQSAACVWNPAVSGTQIRVASCQDLNGNTVADSLCTTPRPAESQGC